jgi:hypothetical protein
MIFTTGFFKVLHKSPELKECAAQIRSKVRRTNYHINILVFEFNFIHKFIKQALIMFTVLHIKNNRKNESEIIVSLLIHIILSFFPVVFNMQNSKNKMSSSRML